MENHKGTVEKPKQNAEGASTRRMMNTVVVADMKLRDIIIFTYPDRISPC